MNYIYLSQISSINWHFCLTILSWQLTLNSSMVVFWKKVSTVYFSIHQKRPCKSENAAAQIVDNFRWNVFACQRNFEQSNTVLVLPPSVLKFTYYNDKIVNFNWKILQECNKKEERKTAETLRKKYWITPCSLLAMLSRLQLLQRENITLKNC